MTRNRTIFVAVMLALGLAFGVESVRAQNTSEPPDAPQPNSGQPAAKDKDAKTKNTKDAKPQDSSTPSDQSTPDAAQDAPAAGKKPSTAADNPFPEDISRKAAADAKADAPAPGHASPANEGPDAADSGDPTRRQLKLTSPDGATDVYDPKRATEDVHVGRYYLKNGEYKGAYARFKDATNFNHEDAEAVYWLAEAARKLNLSSEAVQNYQVYLAAVPDGPNAKAARKALGELSSVTK